MTTLAATVKHLEQHWSLSVGAPFNLAVGRPGLPLPALRPAATWSSRWPGVTRKPSTKPKGCVAGRVEVRSCCTQPKSWKARSPSCSSAASRGAPSRIYPNPSRTSSSHRFCRDSGTSQLRATRSDRCGRCAKSGRMSSSGRLPFKRRSLTVAWCVKGSHFFARFRQQPSGTCCCVRTCTRENVLSAEREPWLVIDPKPYVGDPTYDPLQHLLNCDERLHADPRDLARRMADLLGLDAERYFSGCSLAASRNRSIGPR